MVLGAARREILGPHIDLAAQETLRRQRLLNELAAEAEENAAMAANDQLAALEFVEQVVADLAGGKA